MCKLGRVWEAIQYREKHHKEDWLIIVTTDHGREYDGYGHGGQSDRERRIWIATNASNTNVHFRQMPEMVDILPSMAYHLGLSIPKKIAMELDGTPFIGPVDASNLKAELKNGEISMSWKALSKDGKGRIWVATTNNFKTGGLDNYWLVGDVDLADGKKTFSLNGTESEIFKVVLETPAGYLNYWVMP